MRSIVTRRKLLSLLLCLVMVFNLVPLSAFAVTGEESPILIVESGEQSEMDAPTGEDIPSTQEAPGDADVPTGTGDLSEAGDPSVTDDPTNLSDPEDNPIDLGSSEDVPEDEPGAQEELLGATRAGTGPTRIFFASDYQLKDGYGDPRDNLSAIMTAISSTVDPTTIHNSVFCGDFTNGSGYNYGDDPTANIGVIENLVKEKFSNSQTVYLQGNHDQYKSNLMTSTGAHEYADYIIYVLNTQDANPWNQGSANARSTVQSAANALNTYLQGRISAGETRPVFIATHVPLHMSSRTSSKYSSGDNMYASYLFDVINAAGQSLDIVFFFGHNHSHGWDSYLGGSSVYLPRGSTICIPDCTNVSGRTDKYTEETLTFTYMNAGYVGYYSENTSPADATLTGTVVEIQSNTLVITRYDANGVHKLGSVGTYNKDADGGIYNDANGFGDSGYGSSSAYTPVASDTASPQSILRGGGGSLQPALAIGGGATTASIAESHTLTVSLTNAAGAENVSFTWTTTDASVARLANPNGGRSISGQTVAVDYLKSGTATIECTASFTLNGTVQTLTESWTVTVSAPIATGTTNTYTLVTSTTNLSGSDYLIVFRDRTIVQQSIKTTDGRTGLVCDTTAQITEQTGAATITGDFDAYLWTFDYNNSTWRLQAPGVSGNNWLFLRTDNNFPASWTRRNNSTQFNLEISNTGVAHFKYNSGNNIMQKSTNRGLVYGYGSDASTKDFYIYKKTAATPAEPAMQIVTDAGERPATNYDEATTAVFKAQVANIEEIVSFAWSTTDPTVIGFSDSTAAAPTVRFLKDGTVDVTLTLTYKKNGQDHTLTDTVSITVNDVVGEPTADIFRGSRVVTNILQRRYGVTSATTDELTGQVAGVNAPTITWRSTNTIVATVGTNGNLRFTGQSGYTNIVMTVTGTDTAGQSVTLTRIVPYYASTESGGGTAQGNDYPEYPEEGAVQIDKYAESVDFATTGVAKVTLEADGISSRKPLDIVVVIDMSSSMKDTVDGRKRVEVMNESLHNLTDALLEENPDGTPSGNRLAFVGFNNYDYQQISSGNNVNYSTNENQEGFNHSTTGQDPLLSRAHGTWHGHSDIDTVHTNINSYITATNCKSGTNYDLALQEAYKVLSDAKATQDYNREQVVLFLSDGCPFQWNYFRGYSGNGEAGKGIDWMAWLNGNATNSTVAGILNGTNAYAQQYFNADGKNWWAEAIKSTGDSCKVIDPYGGQSSDKYIRNVPGLGATIYSLGFCLAVDGEITLAQQHSTLNAVASDAGNVYYADSANELDTAFANIAGSLSYAATNTTAVDKLGAAYNMQFASSVTVNGAAIDLSAPQYIGQAPYIEVGKEMLNVDREPIPGSYTPVEKVTFETNGNGELTAAYSSLSGSTNIYDPAARKITATYFTYDLDTETFNCTLGTMYDNTQYSLNYFVYLEGAREGTREAGAYPTNESAVLNYTNHLGNPAQKVFPVPYMPWLAANITYELYLVNQEGQPINARGVVVPFANRVVYYTGTKSINLNTLNELNVAEINANDIPLGYQLFNPDTAYYLQIGSGSNASEAYVADDGTPDAAYIGQTTFVYRPQGVTYIPGSYTPSGSSASYNMCLGHIVDYTNTHVAFAIVATPDFTERTVQKDWDHGNNTALPESVTVQLKADGVPLGDPVVLNEANNWQHTWERLYRYKYANGIATTNEVAYTIEELPVEGYTASVTYDETAEKFTLTNSFGAEPYSLRINKQNSDEAPLSGAGFKLYSDEGCTELATVYVDAACTRLLSEVTDDSTLWTNEYGQLCFYGLTAGDYYIKEFRTPTGYTLLSAPLKLTVAEDGTVTVTNGNGTYSATVTADKEIQITVTDQKLNTDIPLTGGTGVLLFTIGGVALMAGAVGLLAYRRRRNYAR